MPTHHPTRDLKTSRRRDDAPKLAQMFNESHAGWPGGFGEAERRPEDVQRDIEEQGHLAAFVAEADDRIVAYCDVWRQPARPRQAFVGLLNAHPKYHGRGFGKAVLLSAVERAFQLGFDRVDLSTWAGNLKAVPLYKKSGFMWAPETHANMENFTPLIRRMPLARRFFARHDWYDSQQRDLSLKEDLFKRGKVRAYSYLWEADGDLLRVVIDRQSWAPIEVETNDVRVACSLPDERLVAGLPHPIRWEIENKRRGAMQVTLVASGDEGISIDARRTLTVRDRARVRAEFAADPHMPEKEQEPRAAIITTTLILDGEPVEVKAGFAPVQPVEITTDPPAICLRPGREEPVTFSVTSNLTRSAVFQSNIEPLSQVKVQHRASPLRLGPRGTASFDARLTSPQSGPVPLQAGGHVKVAERTVPMKPAEMMLRALEGLECVGSVSKHNLVLESAALRVEQSRRGGWLRVFDKVRLGSGAIECSAPQLGPPFAWDDFFTQRAEARVEQAGDAAVGVITSESATRPGVRLQRRIKLSPGPLVRITDTIINGSRRPLTARLLERAHLPAADSHGQGPEAPSYLVVPTRDGIARFPRAGPGPHPYAFDLHDEPEFWPESWVASEGGEGGACGVVFSRPCRASARWGVAFETPPQTLDPGESLPLDPFYVFLGEGDYRAVRRWWQTLFGEQRVDFREPAPRERPALDFGMEPSPVVISQPEASAKAMITAVGRRKHNGTLQMSPGPGVRVSARTVRFRGVNEELSARRAVTLTRGARERVSETRLALDTGDAVLRKAVPVIALGKPGARVTMRRQGEQWLVRNGLLAAAVAPDFCGSVVSLAMKGEQYLRSAYPEAHPMAYWNPWHGGIRPVLHGLRGNLWDERFTARPVERTGAQGVRWKGVRVSCRPKHQSARHLRLDLEYLLAPGSAVMAVVCRLVRVADTAARAGVGFELWPMLGGSALDAAFSCQAHPDGVRRRTDWEHDLQLGAWGMAHNPRTDHAILVAAADTDARLNAEIIGKPGYVLGCHLHERIPARQAIQCVSYIVMGRDPDHVRSFSALAEMRELP